MDKYYLIYFGEDGVTVNKRTKDEIQNEINKDPEGYHFIDNEEINSGSIDSEYTSHRHLIIKGEVVVPKATEIAISYEIEWFCTFFIITQL